MVISKVVAMRELTVLIPFLVLRSIVPVLLMPELYMEVGCLAQNLGAGAADP